QGADQFRPHPNQRSRTSRSITMKQTPTVGRIVHYQAFGTPGGEHKSEPRAAIVTQIWEKTALGTASETQDNETAEISGSVGLAILNPTGMFFNPNVPYSETPKP